MADGEEYLTPAGYGECVLVEKRSKFIARVWRAAAEEDALARLAETRERHWDASHNVYAYVLGSGRARYSDDGEPQGTSALPILKVIQGRGIRGVCCVVTRYFGGTLLGAGGLARAYSAAAKAALDAAGLSAMRRWRVVLLACPYALFEPAKGLLADHGGIVTSTGFGVDVLMEALLPPDRCAECFDALRDASAGGIEPEVVGTVFRAAGKTDAFHGIGKRTQA